MNKMIQTPGRNPVASSALENFIPNESCPFSSSLSDFFTRKVRLSTNDILSHRYTDTLASCYEVKEPYVSTKDNGEQTIGSLLPEEDDLFSGMIDELGYTAHANRSNDEEDFDLFSSSGGMELDGHYSLPKDYPSEKYFNQGTLVVFNLDSSVSNDELHQTFGRFGEIKEIHGTPDKRYHRFIEYYDTQAAEAALHALNKTDINIDGRWIKFELRHPWSAKQCLMQQFSPDLLQDELIPCRIPSDESSVECIGTNGTHLHIVDSNGHPVDHHVFGSSGGGSFPLHGHCHVWSTSNSLQHHPPSPMVWPNTPLHFNGIHAHCTPKLPLLSRAPSHVLNTHQHHIGSAPAINPFQWDRQNAYKGGSPEAFGFHLDSFGSVGFSNSSLLNLSNCMDKSANSAQCSPLHNCNILPRRNAVTSAPTSFVTPNDRMRNLSHRRIEADSGHADKKKYELDIDRVLRREDNRTTLMIKNIPNKYTSKLLLAAIDEHHRGTYDFLYLPIDFKNNCNMGYAFINMIDSLQIIPFHKAFNGKKWEKFYSEKVASLAYARIQGKAALVAHFQNSSLMNEDKRCRPILFHNDGPNAGDQEPFPMGTSIRSRP